MEKLVLELDHAEAYTLYSAVCEKLSNGVYSEYTRIELNSIKEKLMKYLQN